MPKVLLAMSGGVDSSVAAALLLESGHQVVGVFMRLGSPGEALEELVCDVPGGVAAGPAGAARGGVISRGCCSTSDAADARLVAARLGIPFYVVNFKREFGRVMDYFAGEYAAGRTPNPCVRCNDWLKFGKLHQYAGQIGADFIASGHYARIDGAGRLCRGADAGKDQSYVLFGLPRAQLPRTLFPVGGLPKARVRALAARFALPVADKPDSQEICFVKTDHYADFVESRAPAGLRAGERGAVLDPGGRVVGEHAGHHRFTIGQRRGVGVALGHPVFVVGKDAGANTITIGPREMLLSRACDAGEANWLTDPPAPGAWRACFAKYRYNSAAAPAEVRALGPAQAPGVTRPGRLEVRFEAPQEAVTPGQAIVVYDRAEPDVVLGGAWIDSVRA